MIQVAPLAFLSVDEMLLCYHSNETSWSDRFLSAIYFKEFQKENLIFLCVKVKQKEVKGLRVKKNLSHAQIDVQSHEAHLSLCTRVSPTKKWKGVSTKVHEYINLRKASQLRL